MVQATRRVTPRWFTLWRRGLFAVAGLMVISLIISIVVTLALRSIAPGGQNTQLPNWIKNLARWDRLLCLVGLVFGLLLIGFGIEFMRSRGQKQGVIWRTVGLPSLALVGVALASFIGIMVEMNATIPFIFSNLVTSECSYRITAIVFENRNNNGSYDLNETGIAGVKVTAHHSVSPVTIPKQDARATDVSGAAQFVAMAYSCYRNDAVSISAAAPAGYTATTPLSFGPFPVTVYPTQPPEPVVYVGFRKN